LCAPPMVVGGGGSIVCISSSASVVAHPNLAGYCAAKAGLDALVRAAANELGSVGVRVNAVRPGRTATDSPSVRAMSEDPEMNAELFRTRAIPREGHPADVAAAVRYLAGPESSLVTGVIIPVSGGSELREAASIEKLVRAKW